METSCPFPFEVRKHGDNTQLSARLASVNNGNVGKVIVGQIAETIVQLVIQAQNLAQMWNRTYFFQK